MSRGRLIALSAAAGLLGVLAGTFGAHGLEGRVSEDLLATYEVGVRYHLYHALALLGCAALASSETLARPLRIAAWCFALGIVVFSGSLYLLTLSGQRWLGMITPVGGGAFIAGWACLLWHGLATARSR